MGKLFRVSPSTEGISNCVRNLNLSNYINVDVFGSFVKRLRYSDG